MNIEFEKEVCEWLTIPSIPKKEWDGNSSFKYGVAVINQKGNEKAYAVASFDADKDAKPRIIKVFGCLPFTDTCTIYVVPSYIDNDVDKWDVDDASKDAAKMIINEAKDMEDEMAEKVEIPQNEYFFDHIHNDEEAKAFIKSYNQSNRVSGRVPSNHESIVLRLGVIWAEQTKK